MATVLVTGSRGFLGRNLVVALRRLPDLTVLEFDIHTDAATLGGLVKRADFVFHLAGVNRPSDPGDFAVGNADSAAQLCDLVREAAAADEATASTSGPRRPITIVLSSSAQAALDNPYGRSKLAAEEHLAALANEGSARAVIYRLPNLFGKWCRPNYNSVVATFCHNAAHGLPLEVHDASHELELAYVDDIVRAFTAHLMEEPVPGTEFGTLAVTTRITLGALAAAIGAFPGMQRSATIPDLADPFARKLYATYLSHLEEPALAYELTARTDPRGFLAEFTRSAAGGQIFVSRTLPGITRGNHYHDTKTEKFLVVEGEGLVRLRRIDTSPAGSGACAAAAEASALGSVEFLCTGKALRVVDIPPGYTHSITNVGSGDMVTLFWASEPFNPAWPDTYACEV